jgi:hypothetical protein
VRGAGPGAEVVDAEVGRDGVVEEVADGGLEAGARALGLPRAGGGGEERIGEAERGVGDGPS